MNNVVSKRVMAVASEGGHWVQLLRLSPAFEGMHVTFVTTNAELRSSVPFGNFCTVRDASMSDKLGVLVLAFQMLVAVVRFRPNVVISTGAAPGFFALLWGKLTGAKTIWVDSIANSEELSLAGRKVQRIADHWLTQWPELAKDSGPHYLGSVL